nr:hypothetical protein [Marinicella sp. W31]MDC2877536.1 hypothetical protein [Marinicella sp. W31]
MSLSACENQERRQSTMEQNMVTDSQEHSTSGGAAVRFVHLRTHSAYSLLEGALPLKKS